MIETTERMESLAERRGRNARSGRRKEGELRGFGQRLSSRGDVTEGERRVSRARSWPREPRFEDPLGVVRRAATERPRKRERRVERCAFRGRHARRARGERLRDLARLRGVRSAKVPEAVRGPRRDVGILVGERCQKKRQARRASDASEGPRRPTSNRDVVAPHIVFRDPLGDAPIFRHGQPSQGTGPRVEWASAGLVRRAATAGWRAAVKSDADGPNPLAGLQGPSTLPGSNRERFSQRPCVFGGPCAIARRTPRKLRESSQRSAASEVHLCAAEGKRKTP